MREDQARWDDKYAALDYQKRVAKTLQTYLPQINKGIALDIACGIGQNSLFLSEHGFNVDALDISEVALNQFSHPKIRKEQVDFDTYRFKENQYDLIINFHFLERRLFPTIMAALKPGGFFLFQSFLITKERISNPDHKLRSQELLHAFLPLQIVAYNETGDTATLVARKK